MTADASFLRARNLHLWRGERHVLRGVSCALDAGEALHVYGPNGSGKTSLLRVICGLLQAEEGEVLWQGVSIHDANSAYHASIAYLAHDTALKGDLTPVENLRFSVGVRRELTEQEIRAMLGTSASLIVQTCRRACCQPGNVAGSRSVACCFRVRASGYSMSLSRISMASAASKYRWRWHHTSIRVGWR